MYHKVLEKEITIIGNGGGPAIGGEGWNNTALEQTNPKVGRMMETCVGCTLLKLASQICRLTGDPSTVDVIERYAYNGLIGSMKPTGDSFAYLNNLNGVKCGPANWGARVNGVFVTLLRRKRSDGAGLSAVCGRDEFENGAGGQSL